MPLTTTSKVLGGIGAAIMAAGGIWLAVSGPTTPTPVPADICSGQYFYQRGCDTTWFAAWPGIGEPGRTGQVCSAHTWAVLGEDGKWYPIVDQGPTGRGYKRASSSAPSAQAAWDQCFLPPHNFHSYDGCFLTPPVGTLVYSMKTLAQVPNPPRASFAALYGCSGVPNPTPVGTPVPNPTPNPCAPCPCQTPGVTPPPIVRTPTRPPAPNPTRTYPHARSRIRGPEFTDPT